MSERPQCSDPGPERPSGAGGVNASEPERPAAKQQEREVVSPPADAPFLLACRNQPAGRVPVWFMRQAGRSLPEYRALRGTGSILDAVRDPDLATEVTLQPVRRYGVDAAILYSDIVVPVAALGFGVEISLGGGARRGAPIPQRRRPRPAGPVRSRGPLPLGPGDRAGRGGRAGRRAADRLRRRPVHGGQLPDRGRAVAHPGPHEGPDAGRARAVGPPAGPTGHHRRRRAAGTGGGWCVGGAAVRQLGRDAEPGPLRTGGAARQRPGVRRAWRTSGCRPSTSA